VVQKQRAEAVAAAAQRQLDEAVASRVALRGRFEALEKQVRVCPLCCLVQWWLCYLTSYLVGHLMVQAAEEREEAGRRLAEASEQLQQAREAVAEGRVAAAALDAAKAEAAAAGDERAAEQVRGMGPLSRPSSRPLIWFLVVSRSQAAWAAERAEMKALAASLHRALREVRPI
jgi:hypothetical protein